MKKIKVDFLFRYEHKVRELESLMLIRIELERRGYSVAFVGNYEYGRRDRYSPKVFIAPAVYTNSQLFEDWIKYGYIKKIANLQWEQLLGIKEEEDINGFHNIKGIGQRIVNFCWGERSRDRIVKGGVREDRALVVGQINTDLLRDKFRKLLYTKKELAKKYNLDESKTWLFFISSFAYCEMDDFQIELCKKALGQDGYNSFANASYKSRDAILDWFEGVLKRDSGKLIIYRPHPDETEKCERLKELTRKYPNFRVISQEALKHWVNASDKIYNWFSTGIIDVILLNKPYRLLRPVLIDEGLDYRIMHNAQTIKTKLDFDSDLDDISRKEVISSEMINSYYYIPDKFVYLRICDVLEELLNTDRYDLNYTSSEYFTIELLKFKSVLSHFIMFYYNFVPKSFCPGFLRRRREIKQKTIEMLKKGYDKNVASSSDIEEMKKRLTSILDG